MTLVVDDIKQCCDKKADDPISNKYEIMVQVNRRKAQLGVEQKNRIIKSQDNKCYYCGEDLKRLYFRKGKIKLTKINFDHVIPFSFSHINGEMVASCNLCNSIKHDKIFKNIDDIKVYIANRLSAKGIYSI